MTSKELRQKLLEILSKYAEEVQRVWPENGYHASQVESLQKIETLFGKTNKPSGEPTVEATFYPDDLELQPLADDFVMVDDDETLKGFLTILEHGKPPEGSREWDCSCWTGEKLDQLNNYIHRYAQKMVAAELKEAEARLQAMTTNNRLLDYFDDRITTIERELIKSFPQVDIYVKGIIDLNGEPLPKGVDSICGKLLQAKQRNRAGLEEEKER